MICTLCSTAVKFYILHLKPKHITCACDAHFYHRGGIPRLCKQAIYLINLKQIPNPSGIYTSSSDLSAAHTKPHTAEIVWWSGGLAPPHQSTATHAAYARQESIAHFETPPAVLKYIYIYMCVDHLINTNKTTSHHSAPLPCAK